MVTPQHTKNTRRFKTDSSNLPCPDCLTNPAASCYAITGFVYQGKVGDVIYFDLAKLLTQSPQESFQPKGRNEG